jgi:hypothetical protein
MMNTNQTEEKTFWFQEAAFDVLQGGITPKRDFAYSLVTYRALCAIGDETEAEPGPDRDGRPFETRVLRVGRMVCQDCHTTAKRINRFIKLGLIDPVKVPSDPLETFTIRLRLLDDPKEQKGNL